MEEGRNPLLRFINSVYNILDTPVTLFREKIVEPNRKSYPYYHQKFQRVPTIDECYSDDLVCIYEANQQFLRDKRVDDHILSILRQRYEHCNHIDYNEREARCETLWDYYNQNAANWFSKYGDLGAHPHVKFAFAKQKHRMVWERRHGPIGSGMKKEKYHIDEE